MVVAVVLLAVVALAAIVALAWTRSRLTSQRRAAAAATERATQSEAQLAAANDALATALQEKSAAEERATAADESRAQSSEQTQRAEQRAETANRARQEAQDAADSAAEAQRAAEERAATAERRASELAAAGVESGGGGVDAGVLWSLERARSERTWRLAVAPAPDADSIFANAEDPLIKALRVELDAAREEVGAIVELDAQLPGDLTAAGSLLSLRAAQELLASVVRRAEETTLQLRTEGTDVIVTVRAVDDEGRPVTPATLPLPPSFDAEATEDGVRVRNAVATPER